MSRQDDIRRLQVAYNRRLQKLKEQQALTGIRTAPEVLLECEDLEQKIEHLETALKALQEGGEVTLDQALLAELNTTRKRKLPLFAVIGMGVLLFWLVICGVVAYVFWWPTRSATTLVYVVEGSAQMLAPFEDEPVSKWEVVKTELIDDLAYVPEGANVGLRVFGLGQGCAESQRLVDPLPGQASEIQNQLAELTPKGSEAPLARAILEAYEKDFQFDTGNHNTLIVLTSGIDTCDKEGLAQVTRKIKQLGFQADAYIVGLSVTDPIAHTTLQALAAANDGVYLPVDTATQLEDTLNLIDKNLEEGNSPTMIAPTPTPTSTPIPIPTPATGVFTMTVPGDTEWVDTGIWVTANQSLSFSAFGRINTWGGRPEATLGNPDGWFDSLCPSVVNQSDCLINDAPYGKLIGRIGDNEPFEVGSLLETSAPVDGMLYLSVNDNISYFYDNSGAYEVTIALSVPLPPTPVAVRGTTFKVMVPAEVIWVDTGIEVREGESLIFSASGRVNLRESNAPDPNGYPDNPCQPFDTSECLMHQALYGKLIGKIGDSEPFEVGSELELIAPADGILYLAVNDNAAHFHDNSGAYEVTITDLTLYDNFNDPQFDGKWNERKWAFKGYSGDSTFVEQNNGILTLSRQSLHDGGLKYGPLNINEIGFVEAKLMLDRNIEASPGAVGFGVWFNSWWVACDIGSGLGSDDAVAVCSTKDGHATNTVPVPYNSWHTLRFEINPDTTDISFFVDGMQFDRDYVSSNPEEFKQANFTLDVKVWSDDGGLITGYVDDVRFGQIGPQKHITTTKSDALPR